jgi:uncharacterized RDD family membrane protein YckC
VKHPWRRLAAWLIDWLCVAVWVGVLAIVGFALYSTGALNGLSLLAQNLFSFVVLIAPVTFALAALESRGGRTPGKRALRLRVTDAAASGPVSFGHALLRNTLKIALPWAIGHAAVYGYAAASTSASTPPWVIALTVLAYVLPIAWVIGLFVGSGRTGYDFAAGTIVVTTTKE